MMFNLYVAKRPSETPGGAPVRRCATAHRLLPLKIYLGPQKYPDEKLDGFEQLCSKQKTLACWHIFPISFQREKTIEEIQTIE